MIAKSFLLSLALGAAALAHAADEIKVNPYGKFFSGDGLEVEFAQVMGENKAGLKDALVRIKGAEAFDAGVDGQVVYLTAANGGRGVDYQFKNEDGDTRNRMSMRKTGYDNGESWEVYFGMKTIKLKYDEKKSKDVKPADMLADFKKKK